MIGDSELQRLSELVSESLPQYLDDLRALTSIDCGTYTPEGVDEVGRWLEAQLRDLGAAVERIPGDRFADTVVGRLAGAPEGAALLLVGHMDTVFPAGTVADRPFRTDHARAYAPGVSDMKCGLIAGVYALRALRALAAESSAAEQASAQPTAWLPFRRLAYVGNPDEEVGSPESTPIIRREAEQSDLALVLESARANGDIVSARKGVLDIRLVVRGRAAHAGVEPEKGRSAVVEAAHKTLALAGLNGRWPGVTVNVGVVAGGTRPNVVAEECTLHLDLRATTRAHLEQAIGEIERIAGSSTVPDVSCEVIRGNGFAPMERSGGTAELAQRAIELAGRLGFDLRDVATGGASDANTIAGLDVPVLDGLGPIGGNDHAPGEYLELDSIVPRVALLAALMLDLGRRGAKPPSA
ncbi:MAG TPA: M20 family metallopeptidase [Candidatus Limnocylindrales bacterium]|nr:M20 family metallopeptidase [Candidatus Limnocylindrales bacterium]